MKLTVVYDNEASQAGLQADWSFSCLVEDNGLRLLFDTGLLLRNFEKLNLDPHNIPEIFISHSHWDHVGGLLDILRLNPGAIAYLYVSFPNGKKSKRKINFCQGGRHERQARTQAFAFS
jgi:7,8-dihydropterin-6-yl-methyl-4-(beta-D-ribofuranosyl)aminobenzene 5'-phosphate synthase